MLELIIIQFAVLCFLLWRVDGAYAEREQAKQRADAWEAKCHQLDDLVRQQERELTEARCKVNPTPVDDRLSVYGLCNGHDYLVRFRSEDAANAMLAIQRWYDVPELGLCRGCVAEMQDNVLKGAGIHG